MIDPRLLAVLSCPRCDGAIMPGDGGVCCQQCGRRYPLRYGLPFLVHDATDRDEPGELPPPAPECGADGAPS